MIAKLPAETARRLASMKPGETLGLTVVANEHVGNARSTSEHLLVIATPDGGLFGAYYERGLLETQPTEPFEDADEVSFRPFTKRVIEVTEYVPARQAEQEPQ